MKKLKVSGVPHVVKKKGKDIVVEHPTLDGKYANLNLTKQTKGKVKTVKQGVKSTKEWHDENPHSYKDRSKKK